MSTFGDSLPAGAGRPRLATGAAGLPARLLRALRSRLGNWRRRRAFLNMVTLDDRMLDDIGLKRTDVEAATRLPLEVNASLAVRQIAADRRRRETLTARR